MMGISEFCSWHHHSKGKFVRGDLAGTLSAFAVVEGVKRSNGYTRGKGFCIAAPVFRATAWMSYHMESSFEIVLQALRSSGPRILNNHSGYSFVHDRCSQVKLQGESESTSAFFAKVMRTRDPSMHLQLMDNILHDPFTCINPWICGIKGAYPSTPACRASG